jgi:hypothetical protein
MLIISRKTEEKFIIGGNIEITILEVSGNKVRFGIIRPNRDSSVTPGAPDEDPELASEIRKSAS